MNQILNQTLEQIDSSYDIVIVGGGVTGAGVFHQAVHMGLRALLVESRDFAWGTSSRSSKMVHGGLRYLKEGKLLLTRAAVKERQRLLSVYPGLVTPLDFIMPIYKTHGPSQTTMKAGLSLYSLMAGKKQHQVFSRDKTMDMVPGVNGDALVSAVGFQDAQVDDARLVLRLIFDAQDAGGHALNYTQALAIDRDSKGRVAGIQLSDTETGKQKEVRTPVVINATGAFAETLHPSPVRGFHIRPLRGSHLIFPGAAYPIDRVVSFIHPRDKRPIFLFPWEGCLVLGTTDVDHDKDLNREPGITPSEVDYLMEGVKGILPRLDLKPEDAIAAIAGVRPILSKQKKAASKESREHVVWKDRGLVTVTGGKLTTFSLLAKDALRAAAKYLPLKNKPSNGAKIPGPCHLENTIFDLSVVLRLQGRYGVRADQLSPFLSGHGASCIGSTHTLWGELSHGAGEQVRHLSDLLLRRVRIGLFLPKGGMEIMDEIRNQAAPHLNWTDEKWDREIADYGQIWEQAYSPCPITVESGKETS